MTNQLAAKATEGALAGQEAFAAVADAIHSLDLALVLWDEDLRFVFANQRWYEIMRFGGDVAPPQPGDSVSDYHDQRIESGFYQIPAGSTKEAYKDTLVSGLKSYEKNVLFTLQDRSILSASVFETRLGGYLISYQNVTEEVHAREEAEALRAKTERANTRLRDALESIGEGFALFDKDDKLILANDLYKSANPAAAHLMTFGRPRKEIIEAMTHGGDIVGVEDWIESYDHETSIGDTSSPRRYEVHHADGRVFLASRGRTAEGGCTIVWLDITDSKKTEARARALVNDAMEALDEGFALFDGQMRFLFCNQMYGQIALGGPEFIPPVGTGFEAHIGDVYDRGVYAPAKDMSREAYLEMIRRFATRYQKGAEFERTNGGVLEMSAHETGLGGFLITARDITDKKQTEARARALVNDATESLEEGFALFDADLRFLFCNEKYADLVFGGRAHLPAKGTSAADMSRSLFDRRLYVLPEEITREDFAAQTEEIGRNFVKDILFHRRDGVVLKASCHETGLGGVLITAIDVTEQIAIEEERRQVDARALARVTDTVEALDLALVLLDPDLNFVFCNQRHLEIYHQEVAAPEVGEPMRSIMRRLVMHDFYDDETEAEKLIDHRVSIIRNRTKGYEVRTRDGLILMGSVHRTPDDGYLIALADITEQRRAETELERQREAAHQNEKLSAMGELLAGVAHELNNPLSIVVGYAMMMQNAVAEPKLRRQVDNIATAAERCSRIVKAFLAMARQRPIELRRCSLNELLMAALDMVGHRLRGAGVEVTLDLDPDLPEIEADEDQLIQVFINLIVNAEQAMEAQPEPRKLHLRSYLDAQASAAVVRVADNGPGIAPDVQSRIFEPFFTTKDVGTGTGIGLAFSHRIVQSHGGRMTVRSEPGEGARFYVRLDLADPVPAVPDAAVDAVRQATGRILVVDDETGVAEMIGDILIDAGYGVQIFGDALEALKVLKTQTFDAIVSDIKMPGLDGPGFHSAVLALDPELARRIGFVTGDTLSPTVAAFLKGSGQPHLEKPVTPEELLSLVAGLLGQRGE